MADVTIADYTAASLPLTGAELVEAEQGGNSRKVTTQDIADLVTVPAPQDAVDVPYDNTASGLVATDTQAAIDEIALATGIAARHIVVAYRNAALNSPSNAWAVINMDTETADTGGIFNNTTTYRATPTIAGWYQVTVRARTTTAGTIYAGVYKNGSLAVSLGREIPTNSSSEGGTTLVYCDGSTDYIQPAVFTNSARAFSVGNGIETYFQVVGPVA